MTNNWERRWHPLLQEWVVLAAVTSDRPWSGATVKKSENDGPDFDPKCYLCPGVIRASGDINPDYKKPFAFTNDFASFSFEAPDVHAQNPFETVAPVHGTCRVICFTPKHNVTLAEMSLAEMRDVIALWQEEYATLSKHPKVDNVLIFENKGKVIGVSNPHPHGQIYATGFVPKIVTSERDSFTSYYKANKSHLMEDLVKHEIKNKDRLLYENDHFVAFIPFFARFVYEVYVVPKRHIASIDRLSKAEAESWADIHQKVIIKFDNLYQVSFPNITMLHNAPCDGNPDNELFHFHIEFYPPMRDPDKLKYLAGFESGGGNIINPVKPEQAAALLREAPVVHYKQ